MAQFYQQAEVYSEAVQQYNLALENLSNPKDTLPIVIKNQLGQIQLELKNYQKAKAHLKENQQQAEQMGYKKAWAIAEGILGSCYEKEGNYLKALHHQEKSLNLFKNLNNAKGIATVNENIGSIYEDLEQYDKAYPYFKKALNYFQQNELPQQISALNNIGDVYRKTEKFQEALRYTQKALDLAEHYKEWHQIESAHKDLAEIYADTQEYEKAYTHFLKYDELQKRLLQEQNTRQVNVLQAIYETNQQESKIELLTRQNEVNKAQQNLLIVGICVLVVFCGIVYFNFTRKRRERNKLQRYEQKLLQAKLDKKAIEEKKLTDEIHLKTAALSKYSLNIAQKNKLITDIATNLKNIASRPKMDAGPKLKQLIKELTHHLEQEEEWDEFMNFFKDIHPHFIKNLSKTALGKLSATEVRLAMLLRLNLSSKEIAAILRVTPDSVRVARYRLRKKLPIDSKQKIDNFLLKI